MTTHDELMSEAEVYKPDGADLIAAVRRELDMRKRCYPGWVEAGRMERNRAVWELACVAALLERLEGDLF